MLSFRYNVYYYMESQCIVERHFLTFVCACMRAHSFIAAVNRVLGEQRSFMVSHELLWPRPDAKRPTGPRSPRSLAFGKQQLIYVFSL